MRNRIIGVCLAALVVAACESIGLEDSGAATTGTVLANTQASFQKALNDQAGDRIFFPTGSAGIGQRARPILERQVAWLAENRDVRVRIEGHTDHRGANAFNNALGQARADAVRSYLLSKGVEAERVAAVSFGESRPAARPTSAAALAQNRRAVTTVLIAAGAPIATPLTPQASTVVPQTTEPVDATTPGMVVAEPLPIGQTAPPLPVPATLPTEAE